MNRKNVLITGAAKGIGKAAARLFASHGYNVIINYYHSEQEAFQLAAELSALGSKAVAFKANVADKQQVQAMVNEAFQAFGPIDILVNNAGIAKTSLFGDISEAEWDEILAVNLKGVFHCCQAVLPSMINRKQGRIINVSSIWGLVGGACEVHYSAAKAGVIGFTKALAKEVGPSNIQVNCIAPGVINTDMNSNLDSEEMHVLIENTPLMKIGTPEDVAHSIFFLASDKASFYTGQVFSPNGGFVI